MTTTGESLLSDRDELIAQLQTIEHHVRQLHTSIEHGCGSDDLVEQVVVLRRLVLAVRRCAACVYVRALFETDMASAALTVPLLVVGGRGLWEA